MFSRSLTVVEPSGGLSWSATKPVDLVVAARCLSGVARWIILQERLVRSIFGVYLIAAYFIAEICPEGNTYIRTPFDEETSNLQK